MIQAIATLLNVNPYHVQCLLPIIGMFATGGLVYLYGVLKGWWIKKEASLLHPHALSPGHGLSLLVCA